MTEFRVHLNIMPCYALFQVDIVPLCFMLDHVRLSTAATAYYILSSISICIPMTGRTLDKQALKQLRPLSINLSSNHVLARIAYYPSRAK